MIFSEDLCGELRELIDRMYAELRNRYPDRYSDDVDVNAWIGDLERARGKIAAEEKDWRGPIATRERQGLTIEDCATVNGVSPTTWGRWERGEVANMRPIEVKVTPLVEKAARHFYDGQMQRDIEDAIDEVNATP